MCAAIDRHVFGTHAVDPLTGQVVFQGLELVPNLWVIPKGQVFAVDGIPALVNACVVQEGQGHARGHPPPEGEIGLVGGTQADLGHLAANGAGEVEPAARDRNARVQGREGTLQHWKMK